MATTTAVNATAGPVAYDYASSRIAPAGQADSARTGAAAPQDDKRNPTPDKADKTDQAVVNPTFRYDDQTQRMVMLMRDQKSGTVLAQIPTEAALRQYEQALKRAREEVANQSTATDRTPAAISSLEAAALGVAVPLPSSETAAATRPTSAPAARTGSAAGSVTAGASAARAGGARFTFVV